MSYDLIAPFYDEAMQDYSWCATFLQDIIENSGLPSGGSLLELGCGTGRILEMLEGHFSRIDGVDISKAMLEIASRRLPQAHLHHMDMRAFSLRRSFDMVVCLFDSINHLADIQSWEQTFNQVRNHLRAGGIFVLDMNTPRRLSRLSLFPPDIRRFPGDGMMIMEVCESEKERDTFLFDTEIFAPAGDGLFSYHHTIIKEYTPQPELVLSMLRSCFGRVSFYDEDGQESNALEEISDGRIFFVCRSPVK
jgi:SAM-dependent methyltransferase